ncbi:hypothetical protein AB6D11_06300 [Vibrio splendidus]
MDWKVKEKDIFDRYVGKRTVTELAKLIGKSKGAIYGYAHRRSISLQVNKKSTDFEHRGKGGAYLDLKVFHRRNPKHYGLRGIMNGKSVSGIAVDLPAKYGKTLRGAVMFSQHSTFDNAIQDALVLRDELGTAEWGQALWEGITKHSLHKRIPKPLPVNLDIARLGNRKVADGSRITWDESGELVSVPNIQMRSRLHFTARTKYYPDGLSGKAKIITKTFCIFKYGYAQARNLANEEQAKQRDRWLQKCGIDSTLDIRQTSLLDIVD